jgi:hypothetical protein
MTNGANYKRVKLHHSPWHSDIHTSNQLYIQFVFSSMYLCIYKATHLHTVNHDWLRAVREQFKAQSAKEQIDYRLRYAHTRSS